MLMVSFNYKEKYYGKLTYEYRIPLATTTTPQEENSADHTAYTDVRPFGNEYTEFN